MKEGPRVKFWGLFLYKAINDYSNYDRTKKHLAKTKANLQYIVIIIKLFTYEFKYILEGL